VDAILMNQKKQQFAVEQLISFGSFSFYSQHFLAQLFFILHIITPLKKRAHTAKGNASHFCQAIVPQALNCETR
jgi:hypothetical protein